MDYADGWTWFDSDGNVLSDENVSQMTTEEKAQAFLEGRYAKENPDKMQVQEDAETLSELFNSEEK